MINTEILVVNTQKEKDPLGKINLYRGCGKGKDDPGLYLAPVQCVPQIKHNANPLQEKYCYIKRWFKLSDLSEK
jgi:hypothetical protein